MKQDAPNQHNARQRKTTEATVGKATTTHFAGINTRLLAEAAEGHPILVSFASMLDSHHKCLIETVIPMLRAGRYSSAILDSGAFTVLSQGITISVEQYIEFALEHGDLFDQIVTLDDIAGDLAVTWNNTKAMIDAGLDPIPVFHGREPFDVLRHYCEKFDRVGLGFFRSPSKKGGKVSISPDQGDDLTPDEWLTKALDICEEAGVEVHGFGMTRFAMSSDVQKSGRDHTRLTTTDSTSWNAEYLCLAKRGDKGSDRLGNGDAATLLGTLNDEELIRLTMESYSGSGADDEIVALTEDCRGQANTVLNRFNSTELVALLECFETEGASTRKAIREVAQDGGNTMTKKQKEGVEAVNTCIKFAYNADGEEFSRMMHGRHHFNAINNGYVREKFALMRSDFARYWGSLDTSNRCRFMDAATARAEAQEVKS